MYRFKTYLLPVLIHLAGTLMKCNMNFFKRLLFFRGSFLESKIAAFWQVMILCRGVIYHVPNTLKFAERNVINHAPTKYHCSKGSISRHEHVQISLCSFVCFVWLNEIVLFQSAISRHEHVQISLCSFAYFVWLNEIVGLISQPY